MPKASEPRIVVRVSTGDDEKLDAAASVAGVGKSTLLRESAMRQGRYLDVARELAAEKTSAPAPTVAAPPADPVPPAASTPGQMPFRCPRTECDRRFGSPMAVCPEHGRRAVAA